MSGQSLRNGHAGVLVVFFFPVISFFLPALAHADGSSIHTLNEEQKTEKRLLFNQYIEDELERARKKKSSEGQPPAKKNLISRVSAAYGYDSNVNLDSSHRGDQFFQATAEGSFDFVRRANFPTPWEAKMGLTGYAEYLAYESMEGSDYNSSTLSGFTEERLTPQSALKLQYDLNIVRYMNNDQLTYLGHKFKSTLMHYPTQHFSHNIFVSYERKDFRDRKALSVSDLPLDRLRKDDYYEAGYGTRYYPTDRTYLGATLAWKWNDSNDLFHDFSDYDGYKVNGFIYQKLTGRFSVVGFLGYDHKDYSARTFITGSDRTEKDDFYYYGGYVYHDLNKNWQAFLSYLYKQNNSNDPAQEYVGYTSGAGLNLTF